ncbi:MAG: AIM24 family protein, partial [Oscillospiraceae bacterium]|nr:AIM24 family protein [Oscillospiraceae bacterium]
GTLGKVAKNAVTGENIFRNKYTAVGAPGNIAFAPPFPGEILAFDINKEKTIVAQKGAYFANTLGVEFDIFFQKKLGAGFFGGEGFIMQKFNGTGTVWLTIGGGVAIYDLGPGESMLIDTGYLAAMEETCSVDIERIKGAANVLLGGEGLFNTKVTGPGRIWLQTMPVSSIAGEIGKFIPTSNG